MVMTASVSVKRTARLGENTGQYTGGWWRNSWGVGGGVEPCWRKIKKWGFKKGLIFLAARGRNIKRN